MLIGKTIISSIEYSGKISLVIFTSHCPLRCKYCHNTELLTNGLEINNDTLENIIYENSDFIDAIVISGGEPLIQTNKLKSILSFAQSNGLKTKLDTSGIYPEDLKELLPYLDYVSLDIKAPFNKYKEVTGSNIGGQVFQSMLLVYNDKNTKLECRTTYAPELLTEDDVLEIASKINADIYTIQQFNQTNILDNELSKEPSRNELVEITNKVYDIFDGVVKIKTKEFGEEIIKKE